MILRCVKIILGAGLICFGSSFTASAQVDSTASVKKWVLDIGGSFGLFVPFHQPNGENVFIGTNSITAIQFNYKKHLFARFEIGEVSAEFRYRNSIAGLNVDTKSQANSVNIGFGGGYQYRFGKWQPFLSAGAGPSYVIIPGATYDLTSNTVRFRNNVSIKAHMNVSAGINCYLSEAVILLFEAKTSTVANLPINPNANLTGLSILVNVKITL